MVAKTDQKARLLDLVTSMLELVRDGKRDPEQVASVLQSIKDGKTAKGTLPDVHDQLASWQVFYYNMFGFSLDLSNLKLPEQVPGFDRLIVVAEGLTPTKLVEAMREKMKVWVWDEKWLKKVTSVRKTNKTYGMWVRDRQEADEELKSESANDLEGKGINTITLEERLLYGFKYFIETGKHLDINNVTLCASSRNSYGDVPGVGWGSDYGRVYVDWDYSGYRSEDLRGREAVS